MSEDKTTLIAGRVAQKVAEIHRAASETPNLEVTPPRRGVINAVTTFLGTRREQAPAPSYDISI